ncbi:hypothetical protein MKX01_021612 [Papaver californicum]|nr:hypothetical protein MKX01_021612 [Papaver californicum]
MRLWKDPNYFSYLLFNIPVRLCCEYKANSIENFQDLGGLLLIHKLHDSKNSCMKELLQGHVIPDSILGLEKLEELNLSSNILESLSDFIGLLVNLKYLNVSTNKLKALPDSIINCRSLVELEASFNQLTYLTTKIGELSLHHLDAHFNEVRSLPHVVGLLTNLEILNISALPDTFGCLDSLTKLNLDQNPVFILPNEIVEQGVESIKESMAKRWVHILLGEERKSMEVHTEAQKGWLTRITSWLTGYLAGGEKFLKAQVHYLDQQL